MTYFGMKVVISNNVPKNEAFILPPWFGECKVIDGVMHRYRRTETRNGESRPVYSPLTDEEKRSFAVIKNLS